MSGSPSSTPGRRLRLLILPLVAALAWTTVTAEPAFARHLRSRAFSIVDDTVPLVGVPDRIECFDTGSNYRCENTQQHFQQMLITKANDPPGMLVQNYGADERRTKLIDPKKFSCSRTSGAAGQRLAGEWSCRAGGARFTLRDIAYVQDKNDPSVESALPCVPCVRSP
jgi:hypothetical protein